MNTTCVVDRVADNTMEKRSIRRYIHIAKRRINGSLRWTGKRLRFNEAKAADLVTSYYLTDRLLFAYRLAILLYITWATGMQMYHFFTSSEKQGWSLMSPLDYYMYLTHWCFSFVWLYYLLSTLASGYRVASNLARNVDSDWADSATVMQSAHASLTYSAFIVSLLLSQLVTIAFWAGVLMKFIKNQPHDFGGDHGFFICVNVHGLQSVVMLIDFFLLDKVRLQWVHGVLVYGLIALYLPVNYFYTVVRKQRVYEDVFWMEVDKTLGLFGGVLLTLTFVYVMFVAISKTRESCNVETTVDVKSFEDNDDEPLSYNPEKQVDAA